VELALLVLSLPLVGLLLLPLALVALAQSVRYLLLAMHQLPQQAWRALVQLQQYLSNWALRLAQQESQEQRKQVAYRLQPMQMSQSSESAPLEK
jgi:hypothetical protein